MSALPPKADIQRMSWHVRFVPIADMSPRPRSYYSSMPSIKSSPTKSGVVSRGGSGSMKRQLGCLSARNCGFARPLSVNSGDAPVLSWAITFSQIHAGAFQVCYWAREPVSAAAEAEDGLTERIQAMIFHRSSSLFTIPPIAGIGPTTFSDPLRA